MVSCSVKVFIISLYCSSVALNQVMMGVTGARDSRIQHYSLYMEGMVVDTDSIHSDCLFGSISEPSFHVDYAFADKTTCTHTWNPIIPVEWTDQVKRLVDYPQRVSDQYGECITRRTCNHIDLSEWRSMAYDQYKACRYCYYNSQADMDVSCSYYNQTLVTEEQNADLLHEIINSMYLYVNFTCTIDMDVRVLDVDVSNNSVDINAEDYNCTVAEDIDVLSVVEQVKGTRYKSSNESAFIKQLQTSEELSVDLSSYTSWSVNGGYHWGSNTQRMVTPYSLLIIYNCTSTPPAMTDDHSTTQVLTTGTSTTHPPQSTEDNQHDAITDSSGGISLLILGITLSAALSVTLCALVIVVVLRMMRNRRTLRLPHNDTKI